MSSIRFGRGREYQVFRREDIWRRWDVYSAVQFLNQFRTDSVAMATFRSQVGRGMTASQSTLSEEQVIQGMARMLVSGEIVVAPPERLRQKDPPPLRAQSVAAAPAPRPAPRVEEEEEEEPTFDAGNDGVAQAAVLIASARDGYPFCLECEKHSAALAASARRESPSINRAASAHSRESNASPKSPSVPASAPLASEGTSTQVATPTPNTPAMARQTHWIEVALVGEDGRPIPGEEFVIELPGGKRETGVLDGNGIARLSGLPDSGTCKVCFPRLDGDAWEWVSTEPEPALKS